MTSVRSCLLGLSALAFASGCGLIRDNYDGTLTVAFEIDRQTTQYENEIKVNPASYEEVRDNCAAIEKETGKIRRIYFTVTEQPAGNQARFGWGTVHMRGPEATPWPAVEELQDADAIGDFDAVPLEVGQQVQLRISTAQRAKIARYVFTENCDQEVQMKFWGHSDAGPVKFKADLTFEIDFWGSY